MAVLEQSTIIKKKIIITIICIFIMIGIKNQNLAICCILSRKCVHSKVKNY